MNTPEDGQRWEIIGGELRAQPLPRHRHNHVATGLVVDLGPLRNGGGGGPGGWIIVAPAGLLMPDGDILGPDVAAWRAERYPPSAYDQHAVDVMPDWVCEIASPSTKVDDKARKLPAYLAAGVPFAWIIDPVRRLVEVFEADKDRSAWRLLGALTNETSARVRPFEDIAVNVARLWPPER
jgi:Uma2 family endonuclease